MPARKVENRKKVLPKDWEAGESVRVSLSCSCLGTSEKKCNAAAQFGGKDFFESSTEAMKHGWRFDAHMERAWCPNCARIVMPHLQ